MPSVDEKEDDDRPGQTIAPARLLREEEFIMPALNELLITKFKSLSSSFKVNASPLFHAAVNVYIEQTIGQFDTFVQNYYMVFARRDAFESIVKCLKDVLRSAIIRHAGLLKEKIPSEQLTGVQHLLNDVLNNHYSKHKLYILSRKDSDPMLHGFVIKEFATEFVSTISANKVLFEDVCARLPKANHSVAARFISLVQQQVHDTFDPKMIETVYSKVLNESLDELNKIKNEILMNSIWLIRQIESFEVHGILGCDSEKLNIQLSKLQAMQLNTFDLIYLWSNQSHVAIPKLTKHLQDLVFDYAANIEVVRICKSISLKLSDRHFDVTNLLDILSDLDCLVTLVMEPVRLELKQIYDSLLQHYRFYEQIGDVNDLIMLMIASCTTNIENIPNNKKQLLEMMDPRLLLSSVLYISMILADDNSISVDDFCTHFCLIVNQNFEWLPNMNRKIGLMPAEQDSIIKCAAMTTICWMTQFIMRITDYRVNYESDVDFKNKCWHDADLLAAKSQLMPTLIETDSAQSSSNSTPFTSPRHTASRTFSLPELLEFSLLENEQSARKRLRFGS